uniref:Uncharacterized protein n=1 Tax=Lotus japonicus TaxID=34305 RepID=I3T2T3_LOTJA|nr:unknown [Lotus japonicus]
MNCCQRCFTGWCLIPGIASRVACHLLHHHLPTSLPEPSPCNSYICSYKPSLAVLHNLLHLTHYSSFPINPYHYILYASSFIGEVAIDDSLL